MNSNNKFRNSYRGGGGSGGYSNSGGSGGYSNSGGSGGSTTAGGSGSSRGYEGSGGSRGYEGQRQSRYKTPRNPERMSMLQEQYNQKYDYTAAAEDLLEKDDIVCSPEVFEMECGYRMLGNRHVAILIFEQRKILLQEF